MLCVGKKHYRILKMGFQELTQLPRTALTGSAGTRELPKTPYTISRIDRCDGQELVQFLKCHNEHF
jgi:hypothetical protein